MTAVAMIPGAGGLGWYWHLVEHELKGRGFDAFAVDLAASGQTGLPAYADAVVEAAGDRTGVALVAQSMGGFTVPLLFDRLAPSAVVFVNAMVPRPGETPGEWWGNMDSKRHGPVPHGATATAPSSTWPRTSCTTSLSR